jgi:predicted DNA-binding WGR domain protein
VTLLTEFISSCECHVSIADIFLRAQFVRGIRDNSKGEQISQSKIHTFDESQKKKKKAISLEASKTDSRVVSKKSTTLTSANEEVNEVFKYRNSRRDDDNAQNRNRSTSRPRVKPEQRPKSQSRIDFEKLGIKNLCIRCGRDNHTTE